MIDMTDHIRERIREKIGCIFQSLYTANTGRSPHFGLMMAQHQTITG